MKLFRTKVWTWWDAWLLKWSAFLFGIAVGTYFHTAFAGYFWTIVIAAVVLGISPTIRYFKD